MGDLEHLTQPRRSLDSITRRCSNRLLGLALRHDCAGNYRLRGRFRPVLPIA